MSKTAILLGATGLTGGCLLSLLLEDERFAQVKIFSRRPVAVQHPKIKTFITDLTQLENMAAQFTGDVVFCCIGTTKSKTPDKEQYRAIDYGIPVSAAKLCKSNEIPAFIVVSALGANSNSRVFYNRVKGNMEEAVLEMDLSKAFILQPSLIGGNRDEKRLGERLAQGVFSAFSFLIPKKYKMIEPEEIARAMIFLSHNSYQKDRIPSNEIKKISLQ
ncbi:NAD(P)H-binding protein [Altibacter sp. HG106]|uniref:NAD(P)H-binding protein n=1 Tax=Altibacter sp. HG106 TaxID=3023937 RepID=UPI0023500CE5|nr:NAD(P)H-binding protein [Altibacter sp. HG106]MDC7994902.1 NAD(P)H-binding protein [Altibacter sp. HG106]